MNAKRIVTVVALLGGMACDGGGLPASLGPANKDQGDGPVVKFDLFAEPLPEVPLPIDVAMRPDPNSPTGKRVNAAILVAPTEMEENTRRKIDQLDGWGVYSTISVGFTHPDDPEKAVLDVQNILDRHTGDDFAFPNDAVYVINLDPDSDDYGKPVPLDLGEGNFPFVLQTPDRYYENDPRGGTSTILLETVEEDANGNGELDPGEDTDFDGVLDHPNVLNPNPAIDYMDPADPRYPGHIDRTYQREDPDDPTSPFVLDANGRPIPDLITFYERESNTLLMRPIEPLDEATQYAVVVTKRLVGENGQPVRSPFPYLHHVDQTADLAPLEGILDDHPEFYGSDLGGLDGVAFAWTFTTQSVRMDILKMIDGLEEGTGPFARLHDAFPREAYINPLHGCNPTGGCYRAGACETDEDCDARPGRENRGDRCDGGVCSHHLPSNVYTITADYLAPVLQRVAVDTFGLGANEAAALISTYQFVDYFIFGWIDSPQFLDSDGDGWEEESWDVNWKTGRGNYTPGRVNFIAMVPKDEYVRAYNEENGKDPDAPSPVVFYGHGYTGFRIEGLGFAGSLAKFGLTTVTWECSHHGSQLDPVLRDAALAIFKTEDLADAGLALMDDRAVDMDNNNYDGVGSDPGDLEPPPCGRYPCFPTMHFDVPYSRFEDWGAPLPGGEDTEHSPNAWLGAWDETTSTWANALYQDDVEDSAGDFWTSYVFHTRDIVRQSALDLIRIIHYFRGFDGATPARFDVDGDGEAEPYDFNDDGRNDFSGDFDGDGDIDFGGPDNEYYVWGQSLGGIMSGVLGGTHSSIRAVAPVSGGGGLGDVGIRSTQGGVKEAVILRMMGPLVVTVPAASRYSSSRRDNRTGCCDPAAESCDPSILSLRFIIPQLNNTGEVEIGCLRASGSGNRTLLPDDVVVLRNVRHPDEPRCAVAGTGSLVRLSVPADLHDPLTIEIYDGSSAPGGRALVNAETCAVASGVTLRTRGPLAGVENPTCGSEEACAIATFEVDPPPFEWDDWGMGDELIAPAEGLGLRRSTPDIRRFMGLAQMVLDPGDPSVYAPYYRNSMTIVTVGDMNVPTNTGISIARCAGALPFDADARRADLGDRTPNRTLIDFGAVMGLERLNLPGWGTALIDLDDYSLGTDGYGQVRPATMGAIPEIVNPPTSPLRAWMPSGGEAPSTCTTSYGSYGTGGQALETVECPHGVSSLMLPYISAGGDHGFYLPDPNLPFDINTFMVNTIGRYFQTQGRIIDYRPCLADNSCEYIPEFPYGTDWP
ncbi:MAG: hypothetical protein HY907_13860 [Deltaproteobacteria bacterium]|nr:hypothetical protein [Deltaproteobacteria bacterium]